MNTSSQPPSLWTRTLKWLKGFDEAVNFDSSQYTYDQLRGLQQEVSALTFRVQKIEASSDSCAKAAV
jgi:hypothetical protein